MLGLGKERKNQQKKPYGSEFGRFDEKDLTHQDLVAPSMNGTCFQFLRAKQIQKRSRVRYESQLKGYVEVCRYLSTYRCSYFIILFIYLSTN